MIKQILALGDSFTYGEELSDINLAWPYQIGRHIDANVVNLAQPGSGNRRMVRKVIDQILKYPETDLVLIGWASPGRTEFSDLEGEFDIWPGYNGRLFVRDGQNWRLDLLDYFNKYHSSEYLFEQYLVDVVLLQDFLKQRNIKYLMCNVLANDYYHKVMHGKFQELKSQIDTTYFIGWPNQGMLEWTHKCKKGPNGHFLDDGHFRVADEFLLNMDKLGWVKY